MLHELADESENQCLKMNKSKTKVMMEKDTPMYVDNTQIVNVESYIYLGQKYSTRDKNQDMDNTGTCLKRLVYNSCVLPAMTYGAETWTLTT